MDAEIALLLASDDANFAKNLDAFLTQTMQTFTFSQVLLSKKSQIWAKLYEVASKSDDDVLMSKIFTAIRILSRDKIGLNELITDEWMLLIKTYIGLDVGADSIKDANKSVAVEAAKCLCNIVYNSRVAATTCCENGILESIVKRISTYKEKEFIDEIKYFDMKLLFLISALCSHIRIKLRLEQNAVTYLVDYLEHVLLVECVDGKLNDCQGDIICELLKALFNLTIQIEEADEDDEELCKHLVDLLRMLLLISTNTFERTCTLKNNVINLLTNMPSESYESLITPVDQNKPLPNNLQFNDMNFQAVFEILMLLKEKFIDNTPGLNQQEHLSPIMTVLLKSTDVRLIRKYLKLHILPPLKDVHHRPEDGSELRNYLTKLLTTPVTALRDISSDFLFVLCKKNVNRMIKYTGYGNAAGLFARKGLLGGKRDEGEAYYSSDTDSETEEYAEYKHGINPVLGCYEKRQPNPMDDMTEEQKEHVTMELVNLMDQLTRSGTIKPCTVGKDGKPKPIEHILQLQDGLKESQLNNDSDSD